MLMRANHRAFTSELIADIVAEFISGGRSKFGIFLEDLPPLDPSRFLYRLADSLPEHRIRVSALGLPQDVASRLEPPSQTIELNSSPEVANAWRNDLPGRGEVPHVVLVLGPVPKITSLRTTYYRLEPRVILNAIRDRAIAILPSPERRTFWIGVTQRNDFTIPQLLRLLAEVANVHSAGGSAALIERESSLLYLLGLIPDPTLLRTTGPGQLAQRLRRNRELRQRLRNLRPDDRNKLLAHATSGPQDKQKVAEAALRYSSTGREEYLQAIEYQLLCSMLRATEEKETSERPLRVQTVFADQIAVQSIIAGDAEGAKAALEQVERIFNDEEEEDTLRRGDQSYRPRPRSSSNEVVAISDALVTEEFWGGFVDANRTDDLLLALHQLQGNEVRTIGFAPGAKDWPEEMLQRAIRMGYADSRANEVWDKYKKCRTNLIPYRQQLADRPLLCLAADESLRQNVKDLLDTYRDLALVVQQTAQNLGQAGAPDASQRLVARFLALDIIFVRTRHALDAVCGPTHPFHLWHWLTLHDLMAGERERLSKDEIALLEDTVRTPPPTAPHVLLSPFVIHDVEHPRVLVANGRTGALPLFSEPAARLHGSDGCRALVALAERFLRLQPHAGQGLRITLIDPPLISELLAGLITLANPMEPERTVPVHLRVYRTRTAPEPSADEQDAMDALSAELSESGGSLHLDANRRSPEDIAGELRRHPAHLIAVFDPAAARDLTVNVVDPPPLNPLVLPRVYRYNAFDDRIDAVPAGTGGPFGAYHDLFCTLLARPTTDFVGRRSGASEYAEALALLAENASWLVVLDRGLEPTLQIEACTRLDTRSDGARDVAVFTRRPEAIRDLVAEALQAAGIVPHDSKVEQAIEDLTIFSGEGVLGLLRPGAQPNLTDPRRAKGLIGTLRAGRWYSGRYPDALLLSLDHPSARPWLVSDSEARRADLIGIRSTPAGLVVDVIEVKTDEAAAVAFQCAGDRIEGPAVRQIEATIATMRRVLAAGQVPTLDGARREVLRDCFYRSVASRALEPDQRRRYFGILEALFSEGPISFAGVLVTVQIQNAAIPTDDIDHRTYVSPEGVNITRVHLLEGGQAEGVALRPAVVGAGVTTASNREHAKAAEIQDQAPPVEFPTKPLIRGSAPGHSIRFLIGRDLSGSDVCWDPNNSEKPLRNFGFQVTGSSGSGKTQLLRALLAESRASGLPALILDFKNDYADSYLTEAADLQVHDVARAGLPFNPLALVPDKEGFVRPGYTAFEVAALLRRVFGLGAQQEAALKNAIKEAYREAGIPDAATPVRASDLPDAPGFGTVVQILRVNSSNTALLNRVEPLFDLGIFPENDAVASTFEELLEGRTVLSLHTLPDDRIRSLLAEFLIVRIHGHLLRGEQPRRLTRLILLDEAHRVAQSEKLASLAREGRAFGVGLVVATQFAKDIPDTISGNLETKVFFKASAEDAQSVARTITGNAAGQEARKIVEIVLNLEQHQALVTNQHYAPYTLVKTIPFFMRTAPQYS